MFYILTAIFLWSSLGIIIRISGVPIHLLIFFASVISIPIIWLFLKKEYRQQIPKSKLVFCILTITPVGLLNTFSFFYAYQNTTIANAVLTHYTAPVVVAFLAPIFLKEKFTIRLLLAIAVATAGLWIMLDISASQFINLMIAGDKNTAGILAGLLSGLAYAVLIILIRIFVRDLNPVVITFFQNLFIALILLPFIKIPDNFGSVLWAFAIMGILHWTIAPILYLKGMKKVTASKTAILGYLEPVCAILLGVIFLSESINYQTIIGGLMILLSGYLTIFSSDVS